MLLHYLTTFSRFSATELEHAPLEVVYIYFDTATFDEIERDVKVDFKGFLGIMLLMILGDNRSSIGFDRGHNGPPHWLLHPQWGRDHLLPSQVHPPI